MNVGRRAVWLAACLLLLAGAAGAASAVPAFKAGGGFDAPRRVAEIDRSGSSDVVLVGGDQPHVAWERPDGVWAAPLTGGAPEPWLERRGVRALAGGESGGRAVWARLERDLRSGRYRVAWSWDGTTRTAWEGSVPATPVLVRGSEQPELLLAMVEEGRHVLRHVSWAGQRRTLHATDLERVGVDALRTDAGLHVAWLEGRTDRALGRVQSDWAAWWRPAGGGSAQRLGEARRPAPSDGAHLFVHDAGPGVAWPGVDGRVRLARAGDAPATLGPGRPLGVLGGAVFARDGDVVWRAPAANPGARTPVLRLPAAPTRMEALATGGTRWLAWSSGRYQGGLTVWAADDRRAFRPGPLDRMAARMGWDPYAPWRSLLGQGLSSLLIAVVATMALTPLLWLGAAVAARRGASSGGRQALFGGGLALGAWVLAAAAGVALTPQGNAELRALTGGVALPALLGAASLGLVWTLRRRADAEPLIGTLASAWLASLLLGASWIFATFEAWRRAWPELG